MKVKNVSQKILKQDVIDASGSLQVCAGLKCGSEAAIHAMRKMFEADDNDAILLIDASNAFNSLNRSAALHNIRILCPTLATFAINTYREPARLFIIGGKEIKSAEGTTQGDPIAIAIYAVSLRISQIVRLAEFAQSHPQASYVAYTFGLRHRWTYYLRTLPNIEDLLGPLERAISNVLIPSMVDHKCTQLEEVYTAITSGTSWRLRIYESHSECECRVSSVC